MIECRHGNIPSHCDSCGKEARIEKLEAVRDAAIKMRGLKFNGAWLPTIPTLEEFDAALAAERGEKESRQK